MFQQVTISSLR